MSDLLQKMKMAILTGGRDSVRDVDPEKDSITVLGDKAIVVAFLDDRDEIAIELEINEQGTYLVNRAQGISFRSAERTPRPQARALAFIDTFQLRVWEPGTRSDAVRAAMRERGIPVEDRKPSR